MLYIQYILIIVFLLFFSFFLLFPCFDKNFIFNRFWININIKRAFTQMHLKGGTQRRLLTEPTASDEQFWIIEIRISYRNFVRMTCQKLDRDAREILILISWRCDIARRIRSRIVYTFPGDMRQFWHVYYFSINPLCKIHWFCGEWMINNNLWALIV